jgi:hypothetical protein
MKQRILSCIFLSPSFQEQCVRIFSQRLTVYTIASSEATDAISHKVKKEEIEDIYLFIFMLLDAHK